MSEHIALSTLRAKEFAVRKNFVQFLFVWKLQNSLLTQNCLEINELHISINNDIHTLSVNYFICSFTHVSWITFVSDKLRSLNLFKAHHWHQTTVYELTSWKYSDITPCDFDPMLDVIKSVELDKRVDINKKLVVLSR